MAQFSELVKRNMRIYLRDRGAVFFSLLSMVIVLVLMLFFLGDMNIKSLINALEEIPGRDTAADNDNSEMFIITWTCAGIVSINAVTVTLSVLSSMIKDRTEGRLASIYTAPVSRLTVSASYVATAWVCSVIICILTLAFSEIYCIIKGGEAFSLLAHIKLTGMIAVNSFTYAALMYLMAVLVKTEGAWSGIGTVIGTLVGFLGGIYLPIGSLSDGIGTVMKCTPVIYGAKMFRSVMTEGIGTKLFEAAPDELREEYYNIMGVELEFMGVNVSDAACVVVLLLCGMAFLLAGAVVTQKMSKADR
ncbi:MAG: ABC transporter permease [Lachnospiraceae bacterium]